MLWIQIDSTFSFYLGVKREVFVIDNIMLLAIGAK